MTVTTRVKEFEHTSSALLTLDQFNTVELESEADPPVFTRNRIREVRVCVFAQDSCLNRPLFSHHVAHSYFLYCTGRHGPRLFRKTMSSCSPADCWTTRAKERNLRNGDVLPRRTKRGPNSRNFMSPWRRNSGVTRPLQSASSEAEVPANGEMSQQIVLRPEGELSVPTEQLAVMYPKSKYGRALLLPGQATAEELQASTQPTEEKIDMPAWKEGLSANDAEDIENLFRSEEEMAQKEAIFNKMNKDYLIQQERKESERLSAEAANKDQEKDDVAQAEGHARYTIKTGRGRKRGRESVAGEEEPTTEEALYAAVSSRKISRKINYDAMSAIFDDDGTFSTDILDDGGDPSTEADEVDPVLEMV